MSLKICEGLGISQRILVIYDNFCVLTIALQWHLFIF